MLISSAHGACAIGEALSLVMVDALDFGIGFPAKNVGTQLYVDLKAVESPHIVS
jgi:hypothetical protein